MKFKLIFFTLIFISLFQFVHCQSGEKLVVKVIGRDSVKHSIVLDLALNYQDNCGLNLIYILDPLCFGIKFNKDRKYFKKVKKEEDLYKIINYLDYSHIVIENSSHMFKFFCELGSFTEDHWIAPIDNFGEYPIIKDKVEGVYKIGTFEIFNDWLWVNKDDTKIRLHLLHIPGQLNKNRCDNKMVFTSDWFLLN